MNILKKLLALTLTGALAIGVTACGNSNAVTNEKNVTTETTTTEATTTENTSTENNVVYRTLDEDRKSVV